MRSDCHKKILSLAQIGDFDSLNQELEKSDLNPRDIVHQKTGDCLLHVAARAGHVECLNVLLKEYKMCVDQKNYEFKTALHEAAQSGETGAVEVLVSAGAQVDCLKRADWTPLMLAATRPGNDDCVSRLLAAGGDPVITNKDGWTALQVSVRTGDLSMVETLVNSAPDTINMKSNNGRTVLHTACLAGHSRIVMYLILMTGVVTMVNDQDSCGNTALMDAARAGHLDCVQQLLTLDSVDAGLCDNVGRNIVQVSAEAGTTHILSYLKNTLFMELSTGLTLHSAAREGHADTVQTILECGADADAVDSFGRTALFLSVSGQHVEAARVLLESGASVDVVDKNGVGIRQLARKQEMKELLSKYCSYPDK